mgnify:CR=1 FL=1|tara:strand:- start:1348 stop:2082 length:735 start_codon:yes stop_codon:yes gene_type:complete
MVDQVEIKQDETTAEKPVEQSVETSKPEGLPEKFNSVEDLAKSYSELEKKLGESKPEETPQPKQEEPKTEDLEIANKAAESAGLNVQDLQAEFDNSGELKAESYEALDKAGIPKEYVDQFIAGQLAMRENLVSDVKGVAGGEDSYGEMMEWASNNLSESEKNAYNNAVNNTDVEAIKLAVVGLKARYESANGIEPTLTKGKASPSTEGGFRSWAEVTEAMADARYQKDIAYQDDVKRKIQNSNL